MVTRRLFVLANLALTALALFCAPAVRASQSVPAKELESLELKYEGDEVQAIVEADGQVDHRVYLLEEPPQLVLDVMRVTNDLKDQAPKKSHALLEKVRSQELPMTAYVAGEHDKTFGRLIFDLKGPAQYWIRVETGLLIVGLFPRDADAGNSENDNEDGEAEAEPDVEGGEPAEETESSVYPSHYEIEPEEVNPDVFFATDPLDSEHYKIGPEDVLEIRVFELEQLNRTVRVLADGNINLPLIGLVPVQGLTSTAAAEQVAGKLQNRFVQNPQVSVLITEFNSRKVSLLGAVSKPATYPLVGRRNLLQIIADAGGLSGDAGGILYVFRPLPDGRSARLAVPLNELLIKGDPRWNIWLLADDIATGRSDHGLGFRGGAESGYLQASGGRGRLALAGHRPCRWTERPGIQERYSSQAPFGLG
jgi:protein involved in polysaccharide export with SLBB domain